MSSKRWCGIGEHEWDGDDGIELVSCPAHLRDLREFLIKRECDDVMKIYDAIIRHPDDSPEFKEAMRILAGYILGKD